MMKIRDIASALGMKTSTVHMDLKNGLIKIEEALEGLNDREKVAVLREIFGDGILEADK